jgi:hypothetical protein
MTGKIPAIGPWLFRPEQPARSLFLADTLAVMLAVIGRAGFRQSIEIDI